MKKVWHAIKYGGMEKDFPERFLGTIAEALLPVVIAMAMLPLALPVIVYFI